MCLIFLKFVLQSFVFVVHLVQQLFERIQTQSQRHPVLLQPLHNKQHMVRLQTITKCTKQMLTSLTMSQLLFFNCPMLPASCPQLCFSGCPGLGTCAAQTPWCQHAPLGCSALLWSSPWAAAPSPGPAADAATLVDWKRMLLLQQVSWTVACVCYSPLVSPLAVLSDWTTSVSLLTSTSCMFLSSLAVTVSTWCSRNMFYTNRHIH